MRDDDTPLGDAAGVSWPCCPYRDALARIERLGGGRR